MAPVYDLVIPLHVCLRVLNMFFAMISKLGIEKQKSSC